MEEQDWNDKRIEDWGLNCNRWDTGTKRVLEIIYTRRSVRKYVEGKIEETDLMAILRAGAQAPSAKNKRPVHFIVIEDQEKMKRLAKAGDDARMLEGAAAAIVVAGDSSIQGIMDLLIADCAAATENMLLAAHALGLGAVWCGVIHHDPSSVSQWERAVKSELNLPKEIIPISVIPLGHIEEQKPMINRWNEEKIHREVWR